MKTLINFYTNFLLIFLNLVVYFFVWGCFACSDTPDPFTQQEEGRDAADADTEETGTESTDTEETDTTDTGTEETDTADTDTDDTGTADTDTDDTGTADTDTEDTGTESTDTDKTWWDEYPQICIEQGDAGDGGCREMGFEEFSDCLEQTVWICPTFEQYQKEDGVWAPGFELAIHTYGVDWLVCQKLDDEWKCPMDADFETRCFEHSKIGFTCENPE